MDNTEPRSEESRKVITVESLLQLKRLEKPPAEFWQDFDRRFERKRLQALMRRPSLTDRLASVFSALASPKVALVGASTAAIALLFAGHGMFNATVSHTTPPVASYYAPAQTAAAETHQPVLSVAAADIRTGANSTSFALDTLSLGHDGRTAAAAPTERLSTSHGGRVYFATGAIVNSPASGTTSFY